MKTLTRLLIANRGEIAVRIARTARRMGITTIAVCSDADQGSPHALACDECVPIGGATPAESYLLVERILAAAHSAEAHAIHPGYGFLAEQAAFAAAVENAGLIFVGPSATAIAAMGDKARARRRMGAAGVPVVPGYDGHAQDEATLADAAAQIGFPVMVKAAAGGGGRGMRLVAGPEDLPAALRAATAEAAKGFGDGRLILERAVVEPRHVEVQGVLQLVLLDVAPDFLGHFGAGHGTGADHRAERGTRGHRFHECGVRLTFDFCLHRLLASGLLASGFLACCLFLCGHEFPLLK